MVNSIRFRFIKCDAMGACYNEDMVGRMKHSSWCKIVEMMTGGCLCIVMWNLHDDPQELCTVSISRIIHLMNAQVISEFRCKSQGEIDYYDAYLPCSKARVKAAFSIVTSWRY